MTDYMDILKEETENVERALQEYLDKKIEDVSQLGSWHKKYYQNIKEYMTRGGKRLRPILVAVGYKAIREDVKIENLYRAACSMEMMHNGSLLQDDLIDHDETRRGGKTFHAVYRDLHFERSANMSESNDVGMTMAILGGDSLINMGAAAITSARLDPDVNAICQHYYQHAYQHLVDGVLLEMNMITDPDATPETYLQMVKMKTAVLFERSLMMGAVMARATKSQLAALEEFGMKAGQAFQVQDDILGSFGDEARTGKSTSGDIREGKKTYLVFETFERATPEQRKELDDLLGKGNMTDEEVQRVKNIFIESGALEACRDRMQELLKSGQGALDKAVPPLTKRYKEFLIDISNFLAQRNY